MNVSSLANSSSAVDGIITSGASARMGESDVLQQNELQMLKTGGRRRRRKSSKKSRSASKKRRGSRRMRYSCKDGRRSTY